MASHSEKSGITLFNLEASLPLFEPFLEFVPDAVIGVSESGVIVLANRLSEELFGYSHNELVGRKMEMLVPKRLHTAHVKHRAGYVARPVTRPMGAARALYGVRADGSEFPAGISLECIKSSTRTITIAVIRDISARLNAVRELEQLTADIAHDLNEQLDEINSRADVLSASLEDRPNLQNDIEQIRLATACAEALTRQLS